MIPLILPRVYVCFQNLLFLLQYVDVANYMVFALTAALRINTLGQMGPLRNSIEQLSVAPGGLWSKYVDFYSIAYFNDQQYYLSSLNAILTW
jgi:hypothetical protein